jgi:YVTN family beta-propeller protein
MRWENKYTLLVLHKLEHSFGYYDVQGGKQLKCIRTGSYPHEICLNPSRDKIYIAEMGVRGIESEGQGGSTVAVFDLRSGDRLSTIETGKYDRPHGIATHGYRLYVTSESTRHLLVFDLVSETMICAINLAQECAHMVGISPDGKRAYTANIRSNTITEVDTKGCEVVRHIAVPDRPEGMTFSPDGLFIYCACREAGRIAVIDCERGEMVGQVETGHGPVRVVITPDGKRLAVPLFHSASVEFIDTENSVVSHTKALGPHPAGTCISPDGKLVFVSCEDENLVYVFDMENMEIVQKIKTGDGADAMVCLFSPEVE